MTVNVLFVCLGNICRSPAAEAIMNNLLEKSELAGKVKVDSAGTGGYHIGDPADARMIAAGKKRRYDLLSKARKVYPDQDFSQFDYILAADKTNYEDLRKLMRTSDELENKLYLLCDFCPDAGYNEVPDPYFGGEEGFEEVLDLLEKACAGLLERIRRDHGI